MDFNNAMQNLCTGTMRMNMKCIWGIVIGFSRFFFYCRGRKWEEIKSMSKCVCVCVCVCVCACVLPWSTPWATESTWQRGLSSNGTSSDTAETDSGYYGNKTIRGGRWILVCKCPFKAPSSLLFSCQPHKKWISNTPRPASPFASPPGLRGVERRNVRRALIY